MSTSDDQARRARQHLERSASLKLEVAEQCVNEVIAAADVLVAGFRAGGRLYLCGNGGSAADCQHMATELMSRLTRDFERPPLPAVALTTDTSFITAYANDVGYEGVFDRQVKALGRPGDMLIAISTSGASVSVLRAVEAARGLGMRTIALTGLGGSLGELADVTIVVPSRNTQLVQESHLAIEHILCDLVEQSLFGQGTS